MYVFVSWAYTQAAEEADIVRKEWVDKASKPEGMTEEENEFVANLAIEKCLPEYGEFIHALSNAPYDFFNMPMDKTNRNLLAVRIMVPRMEKMISFSLGKRLPGGDKQPISLSARSFLLNTFPGEWNGDLQAPCSDRVTFVGLKGLKQFMQNFAIACGALDNPLPINLWLRSPQVELCDDVCVRQLVEACASQDKQSNDADKYNKALTGWLGSGTSAERDSALLTTAAYNLGLKA